MVVRQPFEITSRISLYRTRGINQMVTHVASLIAQLEPVRSGGSERSLTEWARSPLASYWSAGAFWSSAICLSETGRTSCR
jgi:hypothetical protein